MLKIISQHPIITHSQDIAQICKPLHALGISYFAHVRIDKENNFTGIGNGPAFSENYFRKQYYNADIHLEKTNRFGKYIIWDDIKRYGKSDQMYRDGLEFGVNHVFTMVGEKNESGSNYYHFASNSSSQAFNHNYLANLDLLELFISHFNNSIKQSSELSRAFELKFNINDNYAAYLVKPEYQEQRLNFIRDLKLLPSPFNAITLDDFPPQQSKCLKLLLEGKTAKEIANNLNLSRRTVEHYIQAIRKKLNCKNKIELFHKINNK